MPVCAVKQQ